MRREGINLARVDGGQAGAGERARECAFKVRDSS